MPRDIPAAPEAIAEAQNAPAPVIDPVAPPPPPQPVDVAAQVQTVAQQDGDAKVLTDSNGVQYHEPDPAHWTWLGYGPDGRPSFYNPLNEGTTINYWYGGGNRQAFVPALGRLILNIATAGVFPFTAVSPSHVSVGSFNGGGYVPVVYDNVTAHVVSANRNVAVRRLTLVGHDNTAPPGQQDTFMLNDSTLAHGQITDGHNGGHVDIATTQGLPGVSPVTNGQDYVTTALEEPLHHSNLPWILALLTGLAIALAGGGVWVWKHPHAFRNDDALVGENLEGLTSAWPIDPNYQESQGGPDDRTWIGQ